MLSLQGCACWPVRLLCSLDKGQLDQSCNMRFFLENLGQGSFSTRVSLCVLCLPACFQVCMHIFITLCKFSGSCVSLFIIGCVSSCVGLRAYWCVFGPGLFMHENLECVFMYIIILGSVNSSFLYVRACVCVS